ncbi:alkaline shock response membrane anchor protein AmaP [Streptomyces sp. NPDC051310]|uniref:alkaline shock response membrane anchor protein AmaP n=1 Tax=Streptomyces sp. NPDC051310 TaxID=3365649 RepID=UPI0037AD994D
MTGVLRTVNRALVGLAGLVLLCVGGAVLAAGLDLGVPSWWPWRGPDAVLLAEDRRGTGDWRWPVAVAVLAALVLLALVWLLAQLRRQRLTEVLVDTGDGEGAVLQGRTLEDAVESEAETLDGVASARVRLTGRRTAPEARVSLTLEPHASPAATLTHLSSEALGHARTSAGLPVLPAEALLRPLKHRPGRVT